MPTIDEQLATLRAFIVQRPPYCSGTLSPPEDALILFYGKESQARRVNLAHATEEELKHLSDTCDVATFGRNQEEVVDETYRKAGKLDSTYFSVKLDGAITELLDVVSTELLQEDTPIRAELYKLNVYGKDSFFKSHKDTPRGISMFGSLVIVYPTPHDGGSLVFRHMDKEWTFDSAKAISEQGDPCIAYAAFYSDVEHEVTLVESGRRVTVTYNLYYADKIPRSVSIRPDTSEPLLKDALKRLLGDPTFLPEGGFLGFGLSYAYPVNIKSWQYGLRLKGSDAVVKKVCEDLSLDVDLKIIYQHVDYEMHMMVDSFADVISADDEESLADQLRQYHNGRTVNVDSSTCGKPEVEIHWVTQLSERNTFSEQYAVYGNEPDISETYGYFGLVVGVGKLGEREPS